MAHFEKSAIQSHALGIPNIDHLITQQIERTAHIYRQYHRRRDDARVAAGRRLNFDIQRRLCRFLAR